MFQSPNHHHQQEELKRLLLILQINSLLLLSDDKYLVIETWFKRVNKWFGLWTNSICFINFDNGKIIYVNGCLILRPHDKILDKIIELFNPHTWSTSFPTQKGSSKLVGTKLFANSSWTCLCSCKSLMIDDEPHQKDFTELSRDHV